MELARQYVDTCRRGSTSKVAEKLRQRKRSGKPRFYTDEHIPKAVVAALRTNGIDVLAVPEAGIMGASDQKHLQRATGNGRVLVTQDHDFLCLVAAGNASGQGKLLELREEDYVMAAKIAGASEAGSSAGTCCPRSFSHLIVSLTLAIPYQNIRTVAHSPWLLIPGLFVICSVLTFNLVGDGLRDAADPYK